jgi:hypothetical protein
VMPFLLLKLLGIGRWLKEAFSALLGWVGRYPWQAGLIAALCLAGWQWRGKEAALDKLAAQELAHAEYVRDVKAASEANAAAAIAQVKAVEAKSAELAKDADHAHELALQDARAATAAYISRNRVRQGPGGSCPGPAPAEGNDPGVPPEVPSDPLVFVREPDLQALVEWATVGVEAHNHAVDKINAGLAKVPEGWPEPAF